MTDQKALAAMLLNQNPDFDYSTILPFKRRRGMDVDQMSTDYMQGDIQPAIPGMLAELLNSPVKSGQMIAGEREIDPGEVFMQAMDFSPAGLLNKAPMGSLGMNVWQGGPHRYGREGAKESLKHVGKGEGATAYGWGRYDAGARVVAEQYQRQLGNDTITIRGTEYKMPGRGGVLTREVREALNLKDYDADYTQEVYDALSNARFSNTSALDEFDGIAKAKIKEIQDDLATATGQEYIKGTTKFLEAEKARLSELRKAIVDADLSPFGRDAHLYKHDLPDEDIARYMDWDKPLSEQPESVRSALAKIVPDHKVKNVGGVQMLEVDGKWTTLDLRDSIPPGAVPDSATGGEIYQYIQNVARRKARDANDLPSTTTLGSAQAASEALRKAGIPGLQYYDGMSRNAGKYAAGQKYGGEIPEITKLDPSLLRVRDAGEVRSVSDDVAAKMDFSEPVEVSLFSDGTLMINDGHHRVAAAKQRGMKSIPVKVTGINAKGENIQKILDADRTRNYVTWDQDVLDRMKLLERNGETFEGGTGTPAMGILSDQMTDRRREGLADLLRQGVKSGLLGGVI